MKICNIEFRKKELFFKVKEFRLVSLKLGFRDEMFTYDVYSPNSKVVYKWLRRFQLSLFRYALSSDRCYLIT